MPEAWVSASSVQRCMSPPAVARLAWDITPLPIENTVSAISINDGSVRLVAELGPYEVANNPDGTDINPNLYGLGVAADGTIYVADAGGNTIYQIAPDTGAFSPLRGGAEPDRSDRGDPDGRRARDAARTAPAGSHQRGDCARRDDHRGAAVRERGMVRRCFDYQADGTYAVRATDPLSMIVNATYGPDGSALCQPAHGGLQRRDAGAGQCLPRRGRWNADPGGGRAPLSARDRLRRGNGNLFVATNSIISGPDAPLGMVLRVDGVAALPA